MMGVAFLSVLTERSSGPGNIDRSLKIKICMEERDVGSSESGVDLTA
jgi:hypothetical protein